MSPTVSVLVPIYNSAMTLPFALASLQAQTYENWECIVVDDGSTDNLACLVDAANDKRIRYFRLDRNHGRGFARQTALERARGEYVTMLDADDWIYPDKLRRQVELFLAEPKLAAVSTGVAICDVSGQIVGLRKLPTVEPVVRGRLKEVVLPPFVFAPSMLKTDAAKRTGFDQTLKRSEDIDFLIRALAGAPYAILTSPLYVYREEVTLKKSISSLNCSCRMFRKHLRAYPVESLMGIAKSRAKQLVYYGAALSGFWDRLVAWRSRPPLAHEIAQHEVARTAVLEKLRSYDRVPR